MNKFILFFACILFSIVCQATNYYISPAGNDVTGNGSIGNPWKTLFKATATVNTAGDTIFVNAGTYVETQKSILAVGVSIKGAGKTLSIIRSTLTTIYEAIISATSNTEGTNGNQSISGIKMDGTRTVSWAIAILGRSNFRIYDCDFIDFVDHGVWFSGFTNTSQNTELAVYATGNKFYNNSMTNCAKFDGFGRGNLNIGGQDGMLIYNNTIIQNRPAGQNGYGIKYLNDGWLRGVKIYNNTITKPPLTLGTMGIGDWPFAIELAHTTGGVEIYNNVLTGAGFDSNVQYKRDSAYSIWFHDNIVRNTSPNQFRQAGVILEFSTEGAIVENNFFENIAYGVLFTPRSFTENAHSGNIINITIQKNLMHLADGTSEPGGNFIFGYADGGPTRQYNWNGMNIYNNTMIWKPGFASPWGIGFPFSAAGGTIRNWNIKNNIISGASNAAIVQCGSCGTVRPDLVDISNNNLYANGNSNQPAWLGGPGPTNYTYLNNTNVTPTYAANFRLPAGSPLIDKGQNVNLPFLGIAPDQGYDEFVSTVGQPPVVNAGPDQVINAPITQATMAGTATDASPGYIVSHAWRKVSGGSATIVDSTNYNTVISGLSAGVYIFRLSATDNDSNTRTDDMQVTVLGPGGQPPVVNAGPDQVINNPVTQANMAGIATDASPGFIVSKLWTKISGGAAVITNDSSLTTTITGLVQGVYVFRLTVVDNDANSVSDDVQITVNGPAQPGNFYYIDPAGNDATGNGSIGNPWKTLFKATSTVNTAGDTIFVNPGTYVETQKSILAVGVSIKGAGKTLSIIRSTLTAIYTAIISATSNAEGTNGNQSISGIKMDGTRTVSWAIVILGRSNFRIYDCDFVDFVDHGVWFSGFINTSQTTELNVYATGNKFYNNSMTNCAKYDGFGRGNLNIGGQDGMLIYNNTILLNRPAGQNGYGIKYLNDGWLRGVKIYNNTITKPPLTLGTMGTGDWPFAIELAHTTGGVEIYNNVLTGAGFDSNVQYKRDSAYSVWFHDNIVRNTSPNQFRQAGVILEFSTEGAIVENNFFENIAYGVIFTPRSLTENAWSGNIINITIQKNLMHLTDGTSEPGGNFIFCYADGGPTRQYNWNGMNIYNNTMIWKPGFASPWGIGFPFTATGGAIKNWNIKNNIIANASNAGIVQCASCGNVRPDSVDISNNNLYANGNGNLPLWLGGQPPTNFTFNNNTFVVPTYLANFRLPAGSPLIDKGQNVGLPFLGATPDQGYDEYAPAVPPPSGSIIINEYTAANQLDLCTNKLTVTNATNFNVGDTVLLIQMKGAIIDSTNTLSFGTITDYRNAGNYEFNYVRSKTGNVIELDKKLNRAFDIATGKVQLIRVPYFTNLTITDTLTCLPWDGYRGGVLVFNVLNNLTLNAPINVSGKGFKGAVGFNPGNATNNCSNNSYNYPMNSLVAAQKGESITSISNNIICGKGSAAGGAGGGLGQNSGGGGGGNGGEGGFGGYQLESCAGPLLDNRGTGGKNLNYSSATNKIFMGSGGGAGHADNAGNIPPSGGNGAGIIIISADRITSNAKKITANGANGLACTMPASPDCHDGMGGGGAGGTILLNVNQYLDNSLVEARGGKGADMVGLVAVNGRVGAGGGGSGGVVFMKNNALPTNLNISNTGGLNGVLTNDGNNNWGATPGNSGVNLFNLAVPVATITFQKNIDSVRIKDSLLICNNYDFKGLAYTNYNAIANWSWNFGDGSTANVQNTTHTFNTPGNYLVKLVATDINGCKDSTTKTFNITAFTADAGSDTSICANGSVVVPLHASAGASYAWTPANLLNNPAIQHPMATVTTTTRFRVTITNARGCVATDSVLITVLSNPPANAGNDTTVCVTTGPVMVPLRASTGASWVWTPANLLNNPTIQNPMATVTTTTLFTVTVTTAQGCVSTASVLISVNNHTANAGNDTTVCTTAGAVAVPLRASAGATYAWTPANLLNNPAIQNPTATVTATTRFTVTITSAQGCVAMDSVLVTVNNHTANAGNDTTVCATQAPVAVPLRASAGASYAWTPANLLNNPAIQNPTATVTTTTRFRVTITSAQGCIATDSVLITVFNNPPANAGNDTTVCTTAGAVAVPLRASAGATYAWTPANLLNNPAIQNPTATVTTTTRFTVTITSALGCVATNSVLITVINHTANAGNDTAVCAIQVPVAVPLRASAGASYAWSPANLLNNPAIQNPTATVTTTTRFRVTITSAQGCVSIDSVLVTVNNHTANAGNDTAVCATGTIPVVIPLRASAGASYAWTPANLLNNRSIQNPTATVTNTTRFTVTITSAQGCVATNSVLITVINHTADAGSNIAVCSSGPVDVPLRASAGTSYAWSPANLLNSPTVQNPVATVNTTTRFTVSITNAQGCVAKDSVLVTVYNQPANTRYPDVQATIYQPIQLQSRNIGVSYQWLPATDLSNNLVFNPTITKTNTGEQKYIINIATANGCRVTDTMLVTVKGVLGIHVPRAFTPNDDGNNDRLFPILVDIKRLNFFRVFNKWGNLVFETNNSNPASGWDGNFKGVAQPGDVYTWTAEGFNFDNIQIIRNGSTFLIR